MSLVVVCSGNGRTLPTAEGSGDRHGAVVLSHFSTVNLRLRTPTWFPALRVPALGQGRIRASASLQNRKPPSFKIFFFFFFFPTIVLLCGAAGKSYSSWLGVLLDPGSRGASAAPALSVRGSLLPASVLSRRISCLYLQQGSSSVTPTWSGPCAQLTHRGGQLKPTLFALCLSGAENMPYQLMMLASTGAEPRWDLSSHREKNHGLFPGKSCLSPLPGSSTSNKPTSPIEAPAETTCASHRAQSWSTAPTDALWLFPPFPAPAAVPPAAGHDKPVGKRSRSGLAGRLWILGNPSLHLLQRMSTKAHGPDAPPRHAERGTEPAARTAGGAV